MDFNTLETYEWVEELKCIICENYLSFFPIHTSEIGNVCGRCEIPKEGFIRNKIYEVVSQEMQFPCRYKSGGCYEKLVPKDIPDHEDLCAYRTSECPTRDFTDCNVQISYPDLVKHCQKVHSNWFLKNGEFTMEVSESQIWYNLMEHNDQLLIVNRKFQVKDNCLQFSITRRENGKTFLVSPYEVSFTCGSRNFSITCHVIAKNYINEISLHSLIDQKNKSLKILGKIYIGTKATIIANESINNTLLLNLLKCSNCSEQLLPPINYSYNQIKCSKCQSSQNVSGMLDDLANLVTYQCQNAKNGCPFTSRPQQIEGHLKFCSFGKQTCPVSDYMQCNWYGFGKDLDLHIVTDHQDMLMSTSSISESILQAQNRCSQNPFFHIVDKNRYRNRCRNVDRSHDIMNESLPLPFTKCYILRFSQYFFLLIFLKQNHKYYWVMQMIGEFQNKFRYEIEVLDGNKSGKKMVSSQLCSQLCKKADLVNNLNNAVYFDSDQIQKLLSNQMINFKVRIFKNS